MVAKVFATGELAGVRALVADDDVDVAEALGALLAMCGMDVRTAGSGKEAFSIFNAHRPDVIVSDIGMRNGTGLELIRRIRDLTPEEGALTPAIAMSGASSPEECFEAGFHFYFRKPIDALVLVDTIRDFVRAERIGRAKWSVTTEGKSDALMRFEGHVTGADMRAAVSALVEVLSRSSSNRRVIVDLTRLSGFDPSVGAVAQSVAWRLRHRISGAQIVGGSALSHLVARSTCFILRFPCEVVAGRRSATARKT